MRYNTMPQIYAVSDFHLGGANRPKSNDAIIAFLDKLRSKKFDQLLLLGDVFDRWAHPIEVMPPEYLTLTSENSDVWKKIVSIAKEKRVLYFPGNHDFEIKKFKDVFSPVEVIDPSEYSQEFPELFAAHGNSVSLLDAEGASDKGDLPYPLGYFKVRFHHTESRISNVPLQYDRFVNRANSKVIRRLQKESSKKRLSKCELDCLLSFISDTILHGLRKDLEKGFPGESLDEIIIKVPDVSSKISFQYVLENYKGFAHRFYYEQFIPSILHADPLCVPWEKLMHAVDIFRTGGLGWYAKCVSEKYPYRLVLMGHTHLALSTLIPIESTSVGNGSRKVAYVNTGCWCSNPMGMPNTVAETSDRDIVLSAPNETVSF